MAVRAINRRIGQVERRIEQQERRIEQQERRIEQVEKRMEDLKDWVGVVVGRFQVRAGKSLEEMVAGALRLALRMRDITPEMVKMRQRIRDERGRIGPAGREYEVDLLVRDGDAYVFEVKSAPEEEDVVRFGDKAELAQEVLGLKGAKKVLVTLAKDPYIEKLCAERGILLV